MTTKYSLDSLVIECTRRCNMNCDHCARGEPENMDMSPFIVDKLFKHIESISTLTLSGGEPSLVPRLLMQIIKKAKENNVYIGSFYIATNAKTVTNDFLRAMFEWHLFCNETDTGNCLEISRDVYHEKVDQQNIDRLMAFRFAGLRNEDDDYHHGDNLIREGRAAENFCASRNRTASELCIDQYDDGDVRINDTLYLNCKGELHSDCDLSYQTQEEGDFLIGKVTDPDFNLGEAIIKYNLKFEEETDE